MNSPLVTDAPATDAPAAHATSGAAEDRQRGGDQEASGRSVRPFRRHQLMLDQEVQGTLIRRVVLYWCLCLAAIVVAGWIWDVWTGVDGASPASSLRRFGPALIGSFLVLPLAIADMLRTSNRFVGPVLRLRNAMNRLVMGDRIDPLRPRQGDFWRDLIDHFNRVQRHRSERPER